MEVPLSSRRGWPLVVALLLGCEATDLTPAETPIATPLAFEPVRAVVHCLNSVGFELKLNGKPVYFSVRYPHDQVFMTEHPDSLGAVKEQFDRVYTPCGIDLESGAPVVGLKERFEHAFPGHPVATAVEARRGTLHVRTEDNYMFFLTAEGFDRASAVEALVGLLASGKPLAEGYFPAIRMRQKIHGQWRDSRRFGLDTFWYYVAPVDTVHLELTAFPLRVTYYSDHVDIRAISADEATALQVKLDQGFDEVPEALRGIGGVVLEPARPWGFSFVYSQFVPFNADIDVQIHRRRPRRGAIPDSDIRGGIDLFCMFIPPARCPPGSELYGLVTSRSSILDRVLELSGESFPANDVRFPEWAEEDYYRRFPHRRP
jgi:hypothetical protein